MQPVSRHGDETRTTVLYARDLMVPIGDDESVKRTRTIDNSLCFYAEESDVSQSSANKKSPPICNVRDFS